MGTDIPNENMFSIIDKTGQTLSLDQIKDKNRSLEGTMVNFDMRQVTDLLGKLETIY